MTELEKIAYAKSFIDKLANGINPLDDTSIPEGDIANNVRLSHCFFYVSDILCQVYANGGIGKVEKTLPFLLHRSSSPISSLLHIQIREARWRKISCSC